MGVLSTTIKALLPEVANRTPKPKVSNNTFRMFSPCSLSSTQRMVLLSGMGTKPMHNLTPPGDRAVFPQRGSFSGDRSLRGGRNARIASRIRHHHCSVTVAPALGLQ